MLEGVAHEAAQRVLSNGCEEQVATLLQQRVRGAREAVCDHPARGPKHGARAQRVDAALED